MTTKLRLRDGESHLLAGLLQDDERRSMTGFPGNHLHSNPEEPLFGVGRHHRADRYRDAADAADHPHARVRRRATSARSMSARTRTSGSPGPPPLIAAPPGEPEVAPAPGAAAPAPGTPPPAPAVPPQGLPVPTAPPGGTPGLGDHAVTAEPGCAARRAAGSNAI